MAILFYELLEKLKRENETDILEILNLTTEDIVERFKDEIEERYELLLSYYEEEEDEEEID